MIYVSEPARLSAQSALRFGGVRDLCAFFELLRPVRCTASTPAGSRHCLRPSISSIYFNCVQVSPHCAWKRQCRLAVAVCTTCVLRVLVLARAPRQPRPAEAKAIWRFQDFCIVYACVRVGGCCMCERDEQ